jgi:hypothetical protein
LSVIVSMIAIIGAEWVERRIRTAKAP